MRAHGRHRHFRSWCVAERACRPQSEEGRTRSSPRRHRAAVAKAARTTAAVNPARIEGGAEQRGDHIPFSGQFPSGACRRIVRPAQSRRLRCREETTSVSGEWRFTSAAQAIDEAPRSSSRSSARSAAIWPERMARDRRSLRRQQHRWRGVPWSIRWAFARRVQRRRIHDRRQPGRARRASALTVAHAERGRLDLPDPRRCRSDLSTSTNWPR